MDKQLKERSEHRMVRAADDWHPCYPGNEICLSISMGLLRPYIEVPVDETLYIVHFSAWGMDDFGMELDYISPGSVEFAEMVYCVWTKHIFDKVPDGVYKMWFLEHGFWYA